MTRRYRWLLVFASLALVLAFVPGCCKCPEPQRIYVDKELGTTVHIPAVQSPENCPSPREVSLSRGAKPDLDHVRWSNETDTTYTLHFRRWPFIGAEQAIVIPPGTTSAWFTLDKKLPPGSYSYYSKPEFPKGPPGDPAIVEEP